MNLICNYAMEFPILGFWLSISRRLERIAFILLGRSMYASFLRVAALAATQFAITDTARFTT